MIGARTLLAVSALLVASQSGCAPQTSVWQSVEGVVPPRFQTRAERTFYRETSHYSDVIAFLDSLERRETTLAFGSIGKSSEGRDIPYVIASRPRANTPAEARATGKPIVYVQANIHAGEVEGKEALLALLRDLALASGPNVLDSIVLIAVPIYNADGNEKWGPQEKQRSEQNGPELVGQRANAQGLDLNRDYIKAEAPETRASLAMWNAWDPDVFVDLHTTDGSFHGYALTYSPSLNPAALLGDYTRGLLAELRSRMHAREGYETFDYGNFADAFGNEVSTDTMHAGWYTYDHRPRFGTNYFGLRNRIAVLSEAFSHDPFERRVKSTYAFTKQLLTLVAEHRDEIRARERAADARTLDSIPLRSALPKFAPSKEVTFEILARVDDGLRTEAGVPRGIRRTGRFRTQIMPVFDRFEAVFLRPPNSFYTLSGNDTATVARLRAHGFEPVPVDVRGLKTERFVIDSVTRSAREFQGHRETRPWGRWRMDSSGVLPHPLVFLSGSRQRLLAYLLDPESDDGFATWDLFDGVLAPGSYPARQYPPSSVNPQ